MAEVDRIIERRYSYSGATIIERVPESEIGDDYEVLTDLIFQTPDGREVSALSIANPNGLRIAIEGHDPSGRPEGGYYLVHSHVVSMPRVMHFPTELHEDGSYMADTLEHYPLWGRPGDWLLLLHEISHALIARLYSQRYLENQAYRDRINAFHQALRWGEVVGCIASHEEYIGRIIHEERDAWAYAIRVLRVFRQQGIDFEPELKTRADIENFVHLRLGSYVVKMLQMMDEEENLRSYVSGLNKTLSGDSSSKLKWNNEYLFAGR